MWTCEKCNEENEDTFDSCWKCQALNSNIEIRKNDEPTQVNDWHDAESYVDLKRNFKAINFKGNISKGIRQLLAKIIVASLSPPSGRLDKMFRFSGGKAIRKHGHGKANPFLKGVYKPLVKYAETGRLNPAEALEFRDALHQKGAPRILSWGLSSIPSFILVWLIPGFFSDYSNFLKDFLEYRVFLFPIFIPIIGEVIRLIYKKWGVEWFLKDCEIED